jgi:hypothetical protein
MSGLFVGTALAVPAIREAVHAWGPRQAVCAFVEALRAGDPSGAESVVSPKLARTLCQSSSWDASVRLNYRIDAVEVSGDFALVTATLSEYGVSVRPQFALERAADGRWRVVEIRDSE